MIFQAATAAGGLDWAGGGGGGGGCCCYLLVLLSSTAACCSVVWWGTTQVGHFFFFFFLRSSFARIKFKFKFGGRGGEAPSHLTGPASIENWRGLKREA